MKKLLGALALLSLSVLALLGLTANGPADAVTAGHTAVTVKVTGCRGCQVSASSWVRLGTEPWTSVARTVRNGRVTFYPPTGRTRGLTFVVTDRHAVNDGAVHTVVERYAGHPAGTAVTSAQASGGRRGFICWAGTSRSTATLHVTVDRYRDRGVDGTWGYNIRPYADPALRTIGDRLPLYKGTYGVQDIPVCFN